MDWYMLLFMACVLLLAAVPHIGRRSFIGAEALGLSKGVNALLLRFASGELLLFGCYAFIHGGVAAGVVTAMAVWAAVFVLWRSAAAVRYRSLTKEGDRWPDCCFTARALFFFRFFVRLLSIGRLLTVVVLCAYLLQQLFRFSPTFLFIWFVYVYVFTVLAGWLGMRKIGTVLLYIVYIVMGMVPFAYYLTGGVARQYEMIVRTVPASLDVNMVSLFVLFWAVLAAAAGQWLADEYVWDIASILKKERVALTFSMAAFCLAPLPLAVAALCVPYAAAASTAAILKRWLLHSSVLIAWPLTIALLAALSLSLSLSLHSVVQIFWHRWSRHLSWTYVISFLLVLALFFIAPLLPMRMVMFSTALLASSCFGLAALRTGEKPMGVIGMIGWVCLFAIAWRWGMRHNVLEAIAWNGIGGFLFTQIYRLIQKIKK
ncbi:hypothetical protein ABS784_05315 [Geobacillus sp. G4]|uniref:Uncharacterized protein n=3 Tax=Geobacillus thermoleovorans group TaxID=1505648 RepID=Q5KXN0_GEOKA|nr:MULTISPECIES: hypothetical protein [Geobacillus]AMV11411.1 hypothetical protein GT3570_10815 [Geobacillus thermoleovorans]AUI38020.1 hypothetical protein CWI35_17065 [[Bacillus] caldolyticus]AWO75584.1 hypothetical protein C1N76_14440 [Geobacillus thermoleovorans]EQB95764.1 hypothetical protein GA8_09960 [Geobacillus sp. A8]MBW7643485.1 hypothetical protein [Geobacillus thermoleovorans]